MVERDICDYRKVGINDIGAVETPTEAGFNYSDIYPTLLEPFERHNGGEFEERGFNAVKFSSARYSSTEAHNEVTIDHLSVDTYAFAEIEQMWRRIQAGAIACRLAIQRR